MDIEDQVTKRDVLLRYCEVSMPPLVICHLLYLCILKWVDNPYLV
jgi:hypothetical protein